ncbi:MAG: histidinol-phosphate transaminase [Gammaproteobacteria bacterium]
MSFDPRALATSGVRELHPYQPGKPIEELERELGISNTLKLASNENPLGPSPKAVAAMQSCLKDVAFYPDGNGFALKTALAAHHNVSADCITLGNGSNDVLDLVARAFMNSGTSAVFSRHAFAVYPIVTQAVGAKSRIAEPNAQDHLMPYGHDLAAMANAVDTHTRVVFVANPNNPTGTWLRADELRSFVASLPQTAIVVVDEAYFEYVREPEYPNTVDWLVDFPNLVVTRTFSKIYGLAGARIGYGVSSPAIADLLNRVRQPFNANSLALAAAAAALGDTTHVEHSISVNAEGLQTLATACEARGLAVIPSVANFLCIEVGRPGGEVYDALLREGVIVRPVGNYGLPQHLRITIGAPAQNARVIAAFDKVLARISHHDDEPSLDL